MRAQLNSGVLVALIMAALVWAHPQVGRNRHVMPEHITKDLDPGVTLQVGPSSFQGEAQTVSVTFQVPFTPTNGDWVALYSPVPTDVTTVTPIKLMFANASNGYNVSGSGVLKFAMINLRSDLIAMFFTNGTDYPVLKAQSAVINNTDPHRPMFPLLFPVKQAHSMGLRWISKSTKSPQVKFGVAMGVLNMSASASSATYTRDMMCGEIAGGVGWREPGQIHQAVMTSLTPGKTYYYQFGDDAYGWSPVMRFKTPPPHGSPMKLIAFGDLGKVMEADTLEPWPINTAFGAQATQQNLYHELSASFPDAVLHIGDISYAVGYSNEWDFFDFEIGPIASRVPYMTCIGNHERDMPNSGSIFVGNDSLGECGIPYEYRYPMPTPAADKPWWSVNYGPIHFLFMSTEHNFSIGSEQYIYLFNDLKNVDRTKTPWVIFSGHRPMYSNSIFCVVNYTQCYNIPWLQANIEPMLYKFRVDIALWGHVHNYQRTCPVYNGTCVSDGVTHVTIGMAGMAMVQGDFPNPPYQNIYDALNDSDYGYSRILVDTKHLTLEFVANTNRTIKDRFVLSK